MSLRSAEACRSFAPSADDASADGSAESAERASLMETRLQGQEDEITLLKASLADALRRIRLHDRLLPVLKQQLVAGLREPGSPAGQPDGLDLTRSICR